VDQGFVSGPSAWQQRPVSPNTVVALAVIGCRTGVGTRPFADDAGAAERRAARILHRATIAAGIRWATDLIHARRARSARTARRGAVGGALALHARLWSARRARSVRTRHADVGGAIHVGRAHRPAALRLSRRAGEIRVAEHDDCETGFAAGAGGARIAARLTRARIRRRGAMVDARRASAGITFCPGTRARTVVAELAGRLADGTVGVYFALGARTRIDSVRALAGFTARPRTRTGTVGTKLAGGLADRAIGIDLTHRAASPGATARAARVARPALGTTARTTRVCGPAGRTAARAARVARPAVGTASRRAGPLTSSGVLACLGASSGHSRRSSLTTPPALLTELGEFPTARRHQERERDRTTNRRSFHALPPGLTEANRRCPSPSRGGRIKESPERAPDGPEPHAGSSDRR